MMPPFFAFNFGIQPGPDARLANAQDRIEHALKFWGITGDMGHELKEAARQIRIFRAEMARAQKVSDDSNKV